MEKNIINDLFTNLNNILNNKKHEINDISEKIHENISKNKRIVIIAVGMTASVAKSVISEIHRYKLDPSLFVIVSGTKTYIDSFDDTLFLEEEHSVAIFELDRIKINKDDLIVAISVTGKTKYIFSALAYTKNLGCTTCLISPFNTSEDSSKLEIDYIIDTEIDSNEASINIKYINSTTIIKVVLENILISSMEKYGRIHQGIIVNTKIDSEKMNDSVISWLVEKHSLTTRKSKDIIKKGNRSLPHIILMLHKNINYEHADLLLEKNNFNILKALEE